MNASKTNQSQGTNPVEVGKAEMVRNNRETATSRDRYPLMDKTPDTKLPLCEHIEIKGGHCVACMEEGKLAFAKVSSNYSVGYKDGRASAIKEFKKFLGKFSQSHACSDGEYKCKCYDKNIPDQNCWLIPKKAFEEFEKELGGTKNE
jgi:hypothetical protein